MANMVDVSRWQRAPEKIEEEEEEEEDSNSSEVEVEAEVYGMCIICFMDYDTERDVYNWVPGGMPCCTTRVHLACLSRWRFKTTFAGLRRNKVNTCPLCIGTYLPAAWFFNVVGHQIQRYVLYRARLEATLCNGAIKSAAIARHERRRPKFFMNRLTSSTNVQDYMEQVWQEMEAWTINAERAEKQQDHGKFVLNYIMARTGNYPCIAPLDGNGNRTLKIWEEIEEPQEALVSGPPASQIPQPHVHDPDAAVERRGEQQHQPQHNGVLADGEVFAQATQPQTPVSQPQEVDIDDDELPDLTDEGQGDEGRLSSDSDSDDDDEIEEVPCSTTWSATPRPRMSHVSEEQRQAARDKEARMSLRSKMARLETKRRATDKDINRQLSTNTDQTRQRIAVIRRELTAMERLVNKQERANYQVLCVRRITLCVTKKLLGCHRPGLKRRCSACGCMISCSTLVPGNHQR